jgi:hypothetical protein
MAIKDLVDLGCTAIADKMRGKTPDEIHVALDIENDYTPSKRPRSGGRTPGHSRIELRLLLAYITFTLVRPAAVSTFSLMSSRQINR